ncbi:MAG: cation transporter [Desulfitobacterium sp.]
MKKKTFRLEGLGCANCAAKMESAINELDGVNNATVNFITTKMVIEAEDEKMSSIIEAAEKIIKKIEPQVIVKKG